MKKIIKNKNMTLEQYLRENHNKDIIDHSLRMNISTQGVSFCIHPDGKNGEKLDFDVIGNELIKKGQRGPKCQQCGTKLPIDEFCSEAWMQIPYSVDGGEHGTIIWVCPDCVAKEYNKKVS